MRVALVPAALMAAGAVLLIEMSYRLSTQPELGTRMRLLVDSRSMRVAVAVDRRRAARRRRRRVLRAAWPRVASAWTFASEQTAAWRRRSASGDESTAPTSDGARPALQLRGVEKRFGATPIIRGVSLDIDRGERHAIIGPNGAGKSTLFNLISGRFAPTRRLDPPERRGDRRRARRIAINRRGLARSFQVTNIFPRLSVFENIRCSVLWSLGYRYSFWRSVDTLARCATSSPERTLEQIGMTARRDMPAGVLTYAEQRALEIGITIAGGAERHPARRADGGHEPRRGRARGRADPRGVARGARS